MTENAIRDVECSECGSAIRRRPINSNTKNPIANFFCSVACKGAHQAKSRPITPDDLRNLYITKGLSAPEIGLLVGRNSKRVWEWLKFDGIETRPRGHDERRHFVKGHKMNVGRKVTAEFRKKISDARSADGSKGLFLPNGDHVLKGRVGKDHPSWKGGLTPERQAFYSSPEWRNACVAVWHRANACCEECGLDHRTIDRVKMNFHVHHKISFQVRETRADPDNLMLLCAPCHRWVHSSNNKSHKHIEVRNEA